MFSPLVRFALLLLPLLLPPAQTNALLIRRPRKPAPQVAATAAESDKKVAAPVDGPVADKPAAEEGVVKPPAERMQFGFEKKADETAGAKEAMVEDAAGQVEDPVGSGSWAFLEKIGLT